MIWATHVVNFKSKTSTHTIKSHILIRILSCLSTLVTIRTQVLLSLTTWAARRVNPVEVLKVPQVLLSMPRIGRHSSTSYQRDTRCSTSTPWRRQRTWCVWSLICKTLTSTTTRKRALKNKKPFYWTGGSGWLTRITQTRRFNTGSMRKFMAKICSRRISLFYHLMWMARRSSRASRIGFSAWRVHLKRRLRGIIQRFSLHFIFKTIRKNWLNSIWIILINSTKDSWDPGSPKPKSHSWSNCATSRTSQLLFRSRYPFSMSSQIWCQTSTRSSSRISSSTSSSFALTCLWATSINSRPRRSTTSTTTWWPRVFNRQLRSTFISQTTRKGSSPRAKPLIWLPLAHLFSTCSVNSKPCKVSSRTASNWRNKRTRTRKNVHSIWKMKYLAKWLKTKAKMPRLKTWHRRRRRATLAVPPFCLAICMLRIESTRFHNNQIIN